MFSLDQLRIFTEPQQGATYDDLLAVARRAEQLGFGAFFRSDHYLAMGGALEAGGLPGPTDAWTTLAGLARDTSTIRLGTLVTSATFRLPGPLAITRRPGRRRCRAGASSSASAPGGTSRSTTAYGIPFPPLGERFDRLEEQLAVITGLWSTPVGERFSYDGEHYRVVDSPALPKPVQAGGVPIIIGGGGPKRTPALAARYAAEYNTPFVSVERFVEQKARVAAACEAIGRDPASLRYTAAAVVCLGADEAEYARRAAAIGRQPDELRRNGVAGTPDEVAPRSERWADAGAERLYLQVLDLDRPRPPRRHRRRQPQLNPTSAGGHMDHRRIEISEESMKSVSPRSILAPYGSEAGTERPNERRSQGGPRPGSVRGPGRSRLPRRAARQQAKAGPQADA